MEDTDEENIKDVEFTSANESGEIPSMEEELIDKVPTGISGFDQLISGGFERKSVIIITGSAGSGKSIFALQFLYNGASLFNEPGLYITFEEDKSSIYKHMLNFGCDFKRLEDERKFVFMSYPPHEVDRFISEGSVIEDVVKEYGIQRLAIDSITSFMLLYDNEYKRRQVFLKTMEVIKNWGCTTLLTSEGTATEQGDIKARFGVEYLADGLISIHMVKKGDAKELEIEIEKLRGIAHERRSTPMEINSKGVVVYPI
jgi:KaiC/GvpD/RAD55 family RecA-like ATPase